MYTKYFGFNEKPFTLTPNPRFIYLSKNHKESFAHLLYGINNHYGFIELIGEVGTGKTTVLRTLLGQLEDEHYRSALIFNPCLSGVELLRSINQEFGIKSDGEYTNDLLAELNRFLLEENSRGITVLLVIDEAQNLRPDVLEQLRLISNLETENDKLIQIILAGQPELEELLARPELRQLNQRIAVRYRLKPMSLAETRAYIRRRMEVAGETGGVSFSNFAIRWIYLYTSGVPRMINILCDRALLVAYGDEKRCITAAIVSRAIREILNVPQRRNVKLVFSAMAAIALIVLVLVTSARWMPGKTSNISSPVTASSNSAPTARSLENILATLDQDTVHLQALNALLLRWNAPALHDTVANLTTPEAAGRLFNDRNLNLTRVAAKLPELLKANIPFLLETRVAGSHGAYSLAVTSVSASTASISPPLGERSSVPIKELETLANGTAYLVWNNFHHIPDKISIGERMFEIRALQQLLKSAGAYAGPIDGIFGPDSMEAVRTFQKKNSIPADDGIGAQTVAYLYRYDTSGRTPSLIKN